MRSLVWLQWAKFDSCYLNNPLVVQVFRYHTHLIIASKQTYYKLLFVKQKCYSDHIVNLNNYSYRDVRNIFKQQPNRSRFTTTVIVMSQCWMFTNQTYTGPLFIFFSSFFLLFFGLLIKLSISFLNFDISHLYHLTN